MLLRQFELSARMASTLLAASKHRPARRTTPRSAISLPRPARRSRAWNDGSCAHIPAGPFLSTPLNSAT